MVGAKHVVDKPSTETTHEKTVGYIKTQTVLVLAKVKTLAIFHDQFHDSSR
jgi:hypothetical protein